MKSKSILRALTVSGLFLLQLNLAFFPVAGRAADDPGVADRTKAVVEDTKVKMKDAATAVQDAANEAKESVQDAGRSVETRFENLWKRVDESRLKNRNRDEIVAWIIMGVLVGSVAGMMTALKTTGLGKVGRLLLGLAGAFLGGIIVHLTKADFGMGPVMIRYEELLFAFIGAVVLIVLGRFIGANSKHKKGE